MATPIPLCVHCQVKPGTSWDHVPPASIFPDPAARHLRTVPACPTCNQRASRDDEYFRDVLVRHHRVADLPAAKGPLERSLRAVSKPEKRRYAEATLRSFRHVEIRTFGGIVLGPGVAYEVDNKRVLRVVRRTVRGLYYWDTKGYVPGHHRIEAWIEPAAAESITPDVQRLLSGSRAIDVEPGVFWYSWTRTSDNPDVLLWLLVFFDEIPIPAIVSPPDRWPAAV